MRVGEFELIEPVPELRNPCAIVMLRPWVDVGRVGTIVLTKLERYLGAKELGRLARPGTYFDFTRYRPRTRIVAGRRTLNTPNSIVHYARSEDDGKDFLFLHLREPHAMGEDYTDAIVTLLKHFEVKEYCRIGGMYDSVPHTRRLLVTGSLNIESTNLMVHLPQYVQLDEDHMGASRLMEVLCAMYGFPNSLADSNRGQQQYVDISSAVEENSSVKNLIEQLETYYDRVLSGSEPSPEEEEGVSLSPDVEDFLKEMGDRLNENQEG